MVTAEVAVVSARLKPVSTGDPTLELELVLVTVVIARPTGSTIMPLVVPSLSSGPPSVIWYVASTTAWPPMAVCVSVASLTVVYVLLVGLYLRSTTPLVVAP